MEHVSREIKPTRLLSQWQEGGTRRERGKTRPARALKRERRPTWEAVGPDREKKSSLRASRHSTEGDGPRYRILERTFGGKILLGGKYYQSSGEKKIKFGKNHDGGGGLFWTICEDQNTNRQYTGEKASTSRAGVESVEKNGQERSGTKSAGGGKAGFEP